MGTEAQQALQRRRPAIQRGGGARNQEGTRRAQQQALRRAGTKTRTHRARGPSKGDIRDANWDQAADQQRAEFKDRYSNQREGAASYGGMGYGPTAPDSAMKKANARANPNQMIRQALNKAADPTVVRAEGSIWDDPQYAALANEHGANYAMKARNFDRQLNMARQTAQVRGEAQANQLAMDEGKLRDQQIQHAAEPYAPNAQGTGVDPRTGLAVDDSGAFTGDIKHAQSTGPGPAAPPTDEQGMTPQDKVKLVESYSRMLADLDTPDETKQLIRQALPQLLPQAQQPSGQPQSAQEVRQKIMEKNPDADPNSEEFKSLYRSSLQRFGLSE